jgi:ferredoxin
MEPGLLAPDASGHHPLGFPAADAAFWTIERLRPFVEGGGGGGGGAGLGEVGTTGKAVGASGRGDSTRPVEPETVTRFLKGWTLKLGAHSVGVTRLRGYHLYTHVGRGDGYGERVELDHTMALALTVEMDKEMVDTAPRAPTAMESARQYVRSGVLAVQLADLIRRLGFRARAHVDGNYRVICPLVARDAGLGEIGRMGLLMTPRLGPRVRIAVVTTDLPLVPDSTFHDPTTLDFCLRCRKCAVSCPSRALPFGDPEEDEKGVLRWKIDAEACFTLWTKLGTDCARCMAVCPYSHPDNLLHAAVRRGIRRNAIFRRCAVWMDDLVYGRRPPPKPLPRWMGSVEATPRESRSVGGGDA